MTYKANYDFLTLTQKAHIEAGEIRNALIDLVTEWTEKEMSAGGKLNIQYFLDEYPEWSHPELYDLIESTIERTAISCWD